MEIKIIFKKGTSWKICREIEKAGFGEAYYFGQSERKNPVMMTLFLKGNKKKIADFFKKIREIISNR